VSALDSTNWHCSSETAADPADPNAAAFRPSNSAPRQGQRHRAGRLYGAPATKHRDQASFFDYVRLDQRRIVEQVQQGDVLARMCQLYGPVLGVAGITTMLLRALLRWRAGCGVGTLRR
jgi:hypothetical protein